MKSVFSIILILSSFLFIVTPALAQETPEEPPTTVAVTLSPLHLAIPVYEFTGEYRLDPKMGAALIGGFGSVDDIFMWELGAQFRYYVLGDFDHGMQVGAEIVHAGLSGSSNEDDVDVSAGVAGTSFGGFIGYKFAASFGLTFDIQAGYQLTRWASEAEATDGETTVSNEDSEDSAGLLFNLTLGWSF